MTATYWGNKGKHQKQYDELYNKLVPDEGNCQTLEGELLRAICRLYYDFYNNGMCNNTSGAANFLLKYNEHLSLGIKRELVKIYDETNTGGYTRVDLKLELEIVVDTIVNYIASRQNQFTANTEDLFDYQDPEFDYDYDDNDGYEYE